MKIVSTPQILLDTLGQKVFINFHAFHGNAPNDPPGCFFQGIVQGIITRIRPTTPVDFEFFDLEIQICYIDEEDRKSYPSWPRLADRDDQHHYFFVSLKQEDDCEEIHGIVAFWK